MLAEPLPVAWRVRITQPSGVVHTERVFHLRQSPSAHKDAQTYAQRWAQRYPEYRVEIAPLTLEAP